MIALCFLRTCGGVNLHKDGLTVTSSPIMWMKALDMLMDRLRIAGANFSNVVALSGSAQVKIYLFIHFFMSNFVFRTYF